MKRHPSSLCHFCLAGRNYRVTVVTRTNESDPFTKLAAYEDVLRVARDRCIGAKFRVNRITGRAEGISIARHNTIARALFIAVFCLLFSHSRFQSRRKIGHASVHC